MRTVLPTLLLLAAVPACAAPTVTQFDIPGAAFTYVGAVSPSGIIAGSYTPSGFDPCGAECGYLRMSDETITTFSVFDVKAMAVYAVTDAGAVVGNFVPGTGKWHTQGFIRMPDGALTAITYRKSFTTVVDMNDSGIAVGQTFSRSRNIGFMWTPDGKRKLFQPLDCTSTNLTGINTAGTVTGFCFRHNEVVGFLRMLDGTTTFFKKVLGEKAIIVNRIDDAGAVTGFYTKKTDAQRGYVRNADGTFHAFDFPSQNPTNFHIAGMATVGGDRQVVGHTQGTNQRYSGFIHHANGTDETFDVSKGDAANTGTFVSGIAASGMVAGSYSDDGLTSHGYVRTP